MDILIGADPELFVKQNGELVTGYGLIPGTKAQPHPVKDGAVQVDGMALEFNITPADSEDGFVFNITSVLTQLRDMVPEHELILEPSVVFSEKNMEGLPPEAVDLGCDPDFNAYTYGMNPAPDGEGGTRTAAGHVHIGWTEGEDTSDDGFFGQCAELVKFLDLFVGIPSILYDGDKKRREMYGRAGAFRPKPYGVEYRVLSNAWLKSERRMRQVYTQTLAAIDAIMGDGVDINQYGGVEVVINQSDAAGALGIMEQLNENVI
tara:strand:- start:3479 stop:4264 length:786 start_codon:yes stop_codon:yes gene_type:complete